MLQINPKTELTLEIVSLSYGPFGISRHEGRVVMVRDTAPGDRVRARIVEIKERYAIAELIEIVDASPLRRRAPCPYVGSCGGCQWQPVDYPAQLRAKQESVRDALRRIGGFTRFEIRPIIAAGGEFHYRRRIRLRRGNDGKIGFSPAASNSLIAVDACHIAAPAINAELPGLPRFFDGVPIAAGEIEIVNGEAPGELILIVFLKGEPGPGTQAAVEQAFARQNAFCGVILKGAGFRRAWGQSCITLRAAADIEQRLEADLFTQINPAGNRAMVEHLLAAGDFTTTERILELYAGAGNFTLPLARRAARVVAVEGDRGAVRSGQLSARRSGVANIEWRAAAAPEAVAQAARRRERFDKIVLDPPRAGAKGMHRGLAALGAGAIFYISCNPTTLARDLANLATVGYSLETVQPFDLFPQTYHVETLAVLRR